MTIQIKKINQFAETILLFIVYCFIIFSTLNPVYAGSIMVPGITGGGTFNFNVSSKREARLETVVRQQHDYSCGSAAVATLLSYHYDMPTPEKNVFEAMFKVGDQKKIRTQGFSMLDMMRYLDSRGFNASGFRMTLDQFAKIGVPGITLINTKGYKHFVVVKGIDGDRVLLGDPAAGTAVVSRKMFEELWNGTVLAARNHIKIARASFNSKNEWNAWPGSPLAAQVYSPAVQSIALPMSMPGTIEIAR